MNAYAVDAKAVGIDLRTATNPTPPDTGTSNAGVLASFYNGTKDSTGNYITLANAANYFANRIKTIPSNPLSHNKPMGMWVDHNLAWLANALGIS